MSYNIMQNAVNLKKTFLLLKNYPAQPFNTVFDNVEVDAIKSFDNPIIL